MKSESSYCQRLWNLVFRLGEILQRLDSPLTDWDRLIDNRSMRACLYDYPLDDSEFEIFKEGFEDKQKEERHGY